MINVAEKAREIAWMAHEGQKHAFGRGSYFDVHLTGVVGILTRLGYGPDYQATGWLHDVLEDTLLGSEDLLKNGIPHEVVSAVENVTKREGEAHVDYMSRVTASGISIATKFADSTFNLAWTSVNSPNLPPELFRQYTLEYAGNLAVLRPLLPPVG